MPLLPPDSSQEKFQSLERGLPLRAVVTPPKPAPARATVYCVKNTGTSKHQLWVQFPTGAAQLLATEP